MTHEAQVKESRTAQCCYCGRESPVSEKLPFFEYRGEGSKFATEGCKCGYNLSAHTVPHVEKHCQRVTGGKAEARGPHDYDSFYCGCRGWD